MRDYTALRTPVEGQALGRAKSRVVPQRLKHNRGAELLAAICIATAFSILGAVYYCAGLLSQKQLYDNIKIDDVSVGGMTRDEALARFSELQSTDPAPLHVMVDGRTWVINPGDISARYSVKETIDAAMAVGRNKGNVLQELGDILALRTAPQNFKFTVLYDEEKLKEAANRIAREASVQPADATLQFQPDSETIFSYTPEVVGKTIDAVDLYEQLKSTLGKRVDTTVTVEAKPRQPNVTAAQLESMTQLIGSCSTVLTDDAVRNNNIALAAAAVNGTFIAPGAEISFNTLTGERTGAKGYNLAPTISGGKLVDQIGGGVCQVSSTVYDAALLAGLETVERHPHTWPMYYVKAGLDAMVDYETQKDLRLKNNSNQGIYLVVKVNTANRPGTVTAELYGLPSPETITVEQKDYEVITPDAPIEQQDSTKSIGWSEVVTEERKGYRVSIYRVYTSGGDTRQELLYNDYYPPQQGRLNVGTKAPSGHHK